MHSLRFDGETGFRRIAPILSDFASSRDICCFLEAKSTIGHGVTESSFSILRTSSMPLIPETSAPMIAKSYVPPSADGNLNLLSTSDAFSVA
jgi:hypothetical protein